MGSECDLECKTPETLVRSISEISLALARICRWLLLVCLLAVFSYSSSAKIGLEFQMQLGNPSNATADTNNHDHFLIQRTVEAIDYSDNLRVPNWASWDLTTDDVGSSGRSSFLTDTTLPGNFYWVKTGDYTYSGYDRGHMCPSGDRTVSSAVNDQVFYMSNILPQAPDNNQGPWANLETYCRTVASQGNELLITCGPNGFSGARVNTNGQVFIPSYVWKIIVVVTNGPGMAVDRITTATRVIAVNMPNTNGIRSTPWTNYLVSVIQLQTNTGYTFFSALPDYTAKVLRAKVDGHPMPVIAPSLTGIMVDGTNLSLSWSSGATGFKLQQNDDPASTNWTVCSGNASSNASVVSVTVPISEGKKFFRLVHH